MSRTSVTSAIPCAARFSEPAQMTSSALRERSARPCSPSAQRRASARLLLPDPFGPTTALMPGPNSTLVRSANDLKPCSRSAEQARLGGRSGSRLTRRRPVRLGCRRRRRAGAPCAWAAAAVSAARRDGPSPTPSTSPSTQTSIRNDVSWSGPVASTSRYDGPVAGPALGVLLEPALGALERADRRLGAELRRRPGRRASRGPARTRGRGRARPRPPRRSRPGGTAGAGRCAAPRPRRGGGLRRGRSGRRAGRGRCVETMAARRALR